MLIKLFKLALHKKEVQLIKNEQDKNMIKIILGKLVYIEIQVIF